jgi:hypothetical protein
MQNQTNTSRFFGGLDVIHCLKILSFVICGKSTAKTFNSSSMQVGSISILMAIGE